MKWLVAAALLAGCSNYSRSNGAEAAAAIAQIGAAAVATGVAAAAASSGAPARPGAIAGEPDVVATTQCSDRASYRLLCVPDGACFFRTSYGREYACRSRDCREGPPASLQAWCGE
jgi:hypothetical protein